MKSKAQRQAEYDRHKAFIALGDLGIIKSILDDDQIPYDMDIDDDITVIFVDANAYKFNTETRRLIQIIHAGPDDWFEIDIPLDYFRAIIGRYYRHKDGLLCFKTYVTEALEKCMTKYDIMPMIKVEYMFDEI
jgi:hypothetical protein